MKKKWFYLLAFLIPFVSMLGICIGNGVYPFGKNSFMHCDMYHQYVPFLVEFWRKLHAGESLAYAWNLGMGSDFTSIYAYYLATPSNWLVYFAPEHLIIEFMTLMILIKIALCGPTFAYYLREKFHTDSPLVWGFSTLYAMSGFVAAYNWNHMWMDVIWLAPLVLLGLEKLVRERKCRLYCLALTASIFTNYYLSIMLCMFLVLYFAVLLFTGGIKWRDKFRAVGNFALYSLLAGGMAAVLLVPVMSAMQATGFDDSGFPKKLVFYFNGLEVLTRHFLTIPKEIGLDHWPNIYCGAVMFLVIPMYLLCGKIPLKQRIAKVLLAAFMLLSFSTNILNFIWHGLNYPDSLPARQSYLYIFLLLTMGFEVALHIKEWKIPWFGIASLIGIVVLALCSIFVTTEGFTVTVAALTWCFFCVYAILAACYLLLPKWRKGLIWTTVAILVGECILNMSVTSVSVVQRNYYATKWANYENLLEMVEKPFQRFESFCAMTKNDGALAGYPGVSIFSSTTGSRMADLYDDLGMEGTKVSYYTDGVTAFTSALLGVGYTFSEQEEDEALYEKIGQSGKMSLYENRYTLPIGFVLSSEWKESLEAAILKGGNNGLKMQNKLGELLGTEGAIFEYAGLGHQIEVSETGHYYAFISGDPGDTVVMNPVSDLADVVVRGEDVETENAETGSDQAESREYDDLKKDCILDLGRLDAGSAWVFTSEEEEQKETDKAEEKNLNMRFYKLNTEMLGKAIEKLSEQPFVTEAYEDGYLKGTVTVREAGELVLSIPDEKGWTVLVDGKEVQKGTWAQAFMSIPLEEGEHVIEMRYHVIGLLPGAMISAVSLGIFLLLTIRDRRKKIEAEQEKVTESVSQIATELETVRETEPETVQKIESEVQNG